MTIEVKELTISATVIKGGEPQGDGGKAPNRLSEQDRAAMISECVEQVLDVIRELHGR